MQSSYDRRDRSYAGFWVRLWAYIIDSVIVFFGLLVVRLVTSGFMSLTEGTFLDGNVLFSYTLKDIVLYIFQVMYFILFTYCTGTTPGKKLLNLRVIQAEGEELTFFDVLYRETIGRFLCGLSIGIGYIIVGIDREKRGIHDMLCDTRVIYAKKIKIYPSGPVYQMPSGYPVPPVPPVPRQITPEDENTGGEAVHSIPPQNHIPPQNDVAPQNHMPPQNDVSPQNHTSPQNSMRPQDYNGPYHVTGSGENEGQGRNS